MESDMKPRQRKYAMVPPIMIQSGTPCPPTPLDLSDCDGPKAAASDEGGRQLLPQLSLQRNVLGGGMPSSPQPACRKISEPPTSLSLHHNGYASAKEGLASTTAFFPSCGQMQMPATYDHLPSGERHFAVPTGNPRSQRNGIPGQLAPPISSSSGQQFLQLPGSGHYPALSPTFSDVSSIMLSPRSPLSRLPSSDGLHSQSSNRGGGCYSGRRVTLPPLSGLSFQSAASNPDLEDHQPSPMIPPPHSLSPYLSSFPDVSVASHLGISPRHSACLSTRKRAHSVSPMSDVADLSSLIRASPSSLMALMGPNPSPGLLSLSPNPPGAIGHLVGHSSPTPYPQYTVKERKTSIEHNQNLMDGTVDTTITNKITISEHPQKLQHPTPATNIGQQNLCLQTAEPMEYPIPTSTSKSGDSKHHKMSPDQLIACRWGTCSLQFPTIVDLVQHIEDSHLEKGVSDFVCLWKDCPRKRKPFNARYKLVIHMRIHSGEKPNKCKFPGCTKAFSRLENLKIHMRTHTGEKPYSCQYQGCGKSFSNSSDRSKHQKTHYEQKPYACTHPGCDKRYTDPSSLRKHSRTHMQRKKARNEECTGEGLDECLRVQGLQCNSNATSGRRTDLGRGSKQNTIKHKTPTTYTNIQRDSFEEQCAHMQNGIITSQGSVPAYEYSQHQPSCSPYHHCNGHHLQPLSPGYLMAQGSPLPPTMIHSPAMFKQEQFSPMQASIANVHAQCSQPHHTAASTGMQHSPKVTKLSPHSQGQPSPHVCYSNCNSPMQLQVSSNNPQQPAATSGISSIGNLNQQYIHHIHTLPPAQCLTVHTHHPSHPPPEYKELFQPKHFAMPYHSLQPLYQQPAASFHYPGNPAAAAALSQDYSLTHISAPPSMFYQTAPPEMPLR